MAVWGSEIILTRAFSQNDPHRHTTYTPDQRGRLSRWTNTEAGDVPRAAPTTHIPETLSAETTTQELSVPYAL